MKAEQEFEENLRYPFQLSNFTFNFLVFHVFDTVCISRFLIGLTDTHTHIVSRDDHYLLTWTEMFILYTQAHINIASNDDF